MDSELQRRVAGPEAGILRCPRCRSTLVSDGADAHRCPDCAARYPVINGIPRMLDEELREAIEGRRRAGATDERPVETARSFGYEWSQFPEMHAEYGRNFSEYFAPLTPAYFSGKRVLDAGCGSGRHAYYAANYGADVWAVDLGPAVEVARRNTAGCRSVHVVQADLNHLPFANQSFDLIYSLGVLHHLSDPERGFRSLLPFLKPGGEIRIFLYWKPEGQPVKGALLAAVAAVRRVTCRLPHGFVYTISYPAAVLAHMIFVWPYRALRRLPGLRGLAEDLPMKQYANYPFRVCVNDQFDRFSAPIEHRYTHREAEDWLRRAGLEEIEVRPCFGWVGSGRMPVGDRGASPEGAACAR